jgi:hypothetical protein
MGVVNLIWNSIYGYYVPANIRVGVSVAQVTTALSLVILASAIALTTPHKKYPLWGNFSFRGLLVLFFFAFTITWIMGLGGYRRSSLRLFWHVNELLRDNSPWAFTHTIGFAANIISMNALIFWLGLLLILWLTRLGNKHAEKGFR